jgi:hypothetical protein
VGKIDEPELHLRTEEDGPEQSKTPMSTLKVQMPETAEDITDLRTEQRKGQGQGPHCGSAPMQDQRAVKARPLRRKSPPAVAQSLERGSVSDQGSVNCRDSEPQAVRIVLYRCVGGRGRTSPGICSPLIPALWQ